MKHLRSMVAALSALALVLTLASPVAAQSADRLDPPVEQLKLECQVRSTDPAQVAIGCEWSESQLERTAGYRLWRAARGDGGLRVIFRTGDVATTTYVDTNVSKGHRYLYSVQGVDAAGRTTGWSRVSTVDLTGHERLRLACEETRTDLAADRTSIGCKWSEATHPAAAGYRLWRAQQGHGREVIFRTGNLGENTFRDQKVKFNTTYFYAVQAVSESGRTVGWSKAVRVHTAPGPVTDRPTTDRVPTDEPRPTDEKPVEPVVDVKPADTPEPTDKPPVEPTDQPVDKPVDRPTDEPTEPPSDKPSDEAPAIQPLDLGCEHRPGSDVQGEAIACKWSEATARGAAGYVLYRSIDGEARQKVRRTGLDGRRFFVDHVRPGHRYTYGVVAVTADGRVVAQSRPVTVAIPAPDRLADA